ncbi:hypothetical protein KIL84_000809 [Mauremys mutica]|uniref:Uncharacterized protein n=1 Tax=Mauremys mutica TaxID=74926 RepID=A0A9D3WTB1_9SAUR|nr:hypothetical protein KIL84_000809 [Mauremys mutica]
MWRQSYWAIKVTAWAWCLCIWIMVFMELQGLISTWEQYISVCVTVPETSDHSAQPIPTVAHHGHFLSKETLLSFVCLGPKGSHITSDSGPCFSPAGRQPVSSDTAGTGSLNQSQEMSILQHNPVSL